MSTPIERLARVVRDYLAEEASTPCQVTGDDAAGGAGGGGREEVSPVRHRLEMELACYERLAAEGPAFRHVLVAVDSSEQAGWAVDAAGRIARDAGAKVTLIHVVGIPVGFGPEKAYLPPPADSADRDDAADVLRRAADRIPAGVECDQIVYEADPARRIIDAAKELGADLIVIGRHARGGVARFFLGSVAEAVVRNAHCPVLTVAHPAPPEGPGFELHVGETDAVAGA